MAILPDFTLPSNPDITVRLREATIEEAMDFSELDPDLEEAATTAFLERIQEKDKYTDPRLWTEQDRRFALFVYSLHTDTIDSILMTYYCQECHKEHTVTVKYADIMDTYVSIEGKAVRDVVHDGHAVIVHPVLGRDLEEIERLRIIMKGTCSEQERRRTRASMTLLRFLSYIDIPALKEGVSEAERRPEVKKYILNMAHREFLEFRGKVLDALKTLQHGIPTAFIDGRVMLKTPPVRCPEGKGGDGVVLDYPFRAFDFIPFL